MGAETLTAFLYDVPAGELERQGDRLSFRYLPSYQSQPDATPLSLSMPTEVNKHGHRVVDAFLRGLLPDNEAVLARWGREHDVSPRNPFALLAHVGEECAGAVQFVRPERIAALAAGSVEWLDEEDIASRIRMLRQDPTAWQLSGTLGQWSLAGAQAKIALHFDGRSWGKPSGRTPTTHILKPAITGLDDHDLNEHLCLDLARRLGLTAARSQIREFAGERVVIVSRYDRVQTPQGWLRVHQEDMCQALGVAPDRKYQNDGGPSPEQIAQLLRSTAHDADDAVRAFVDALALSWILVGSDAHAKNYSVLLSGSAVRLAPLYDVASVLPYDDTGGRRLRLPMKIGGSYDPAHVGRDHWARMADAVGLDADATLARVLDLAARTPDAVADACAAEEIRALGRPLPALLRDTVAARASHCVRRLRSSATTGDGPSGWTAHHAEVLISALAKPQRRLLAELTAADGALPADALRSVLGEERGSLRGLTGPVTKAVARLQLRGLLPHDLPRTLTTEYQVEATGQRRVQRLVMSPATVAAFRTALAQPPV